MKYIRNSKFIILLIFLATIGNNSCKKFLNVNPPTNLSGNNFWETPNDFENYMNGIYANFRQYTMNSSAFFTATGDYRAGPYETNGSGSYSYIKLLENNDLIGLTTTYENNYGNKVFSPITDWTAFYQIVASCNIMVDEVNKSTTVLSDDQKKQYKGEAIFMRNLCYFLMVRVFGDVPYYTDPYNPNPGPRQNMITVLGKCITDLSQAVEMLPWTYADPTRVAVRAMKGSALDLMMNMNMWCAGFDIANQPRYWKATDSLGNILLTQNNGAYGLLPIEQFSTIFRGGSKESLFDIFQDVNKNEIFTQTSFYEYNFIEEPFIPNQTNANAGIIKGIMDKFYPPNLPDKRHTLWFSQPTSDQSTTVNCLKFANVYSPSATTHVVNNNQIVFRLPDAILLRAEACADLGENSAAIAMLNMIRARAGATLYVDGADLYNLSDAIYYERCKELIGEGYYYYDLVRTRKILLSTNYTQYPMAASAFAQGSWTWPISQNALTNNPQVTINNYWR